MRAPACNILSSVIKSGKNVWDGLLPVTLYMTSVLSLVIPTCLQMLAREGTKLFMCMYLLKGGPVNYCRCRTCMVTLLLEMYSSFCLYKQEICV